MGTLSFLAVNRRNRCLKTKFFSTRVYCDQELMDGVLFEVFVIHDFLTDEEIDDLWDASPTLKRGVLVSDDKKDRFSEVRSGPNPYLNIP